MKSRYIYIMLVVLAAVAATGTAEEAKAQFTMSTIGENAELSVPMPLLSRNIDTHIVNAAEAALWRKAVWRHHNTVDFQVRLTGMLTQFNKAWMVNNQNSVAAELAAYYYHTYTKNRHTSLFKFDGMYGVNLIDDAWFKNQDMLRLYYLASWKLREKGALRNWAYSFSTTFASQFAEGFKSRTERNIPWSNFMAPGTLNAGVGLTYTSPNPKVPFIVTVNPIAFDALFVMDDRIADDRRKQLGIAVPGDALAGQYEYIDHKSKIEGGSNLNVAFNRTFVFGKKQGFTMQYITTLSSFYGWMTQVARKEVEGVEPTPPPPALVPTVGWTNTLVLTPLRFLALEFRTTTIYDRSQVDKVQMQYYFRVGLTYRYKNK